MSDFYTDTIVNDPRFNSTERVADLGLLEPVMRQKVQQIVADAASHGLTMMVFETYRSQARQQQLFDQHATELRNVGVHHYGIACDIVKIVNGEPSWRGDFSLLGRLAHAYGLIWGGDWGHPERPHSFVDSVHVQRCSIRRQGALFRGEWYPDDNYDPYKD